MLVGDTMPFKQQHNSKADQHLHADDDLLEGHLDLLGHAVLQHLDHFCVETAKSCKFCKEMFVLHMVCENLLKICNIYMSVLHTDTLK